MKSPNSQSPRRAIAGFSLIELMVVVLIIGILAGFVVPAVNGVGRSSSLVAAGNSVVDMVNFARQEAMTKNTMTALIVLGDQPNPPTSPSGQQDVSQDYRALTVVEYDPVAGWSQITAWEILPAGIIFDFKDQANSTFFANSPQTFPFISRFEGQQTPPVKFQGVQVQSGVGYAGRIFMPNGALQNPEQPAQLRLVEGFSQGGQLVYTHRGSQQAAANYYDVAIIGMTGIAKVNRP